MPLFDRSGPPQGTGPMTGRRAGLCGYNGSGIDWQLVSMVGFGIVFLANVLMFIKERRS